MLLSKKLNELPKARFFNKRSYWYDQADASARYFSGTQIYTLLSLNYSNWGPPVARVQQGPCEELDNKDPVALAKARELRDVIAKLEITHAGKTPP